jgi:hypothetical protein
MRPVAISHLQIGHARRIPDVQLTTIVQNGRSEYTVCNVATKNGDASLACFNSSIACMGCQSWHKLVPSICMQWTSRRGGGWGLGTMAVGVHTMVPC